MAGLADRIDDNQALRFVSNSQGKAVGGTARRVAEGKIPVAILRYSLKHASVYTASYHLPRHEGFDVRTKLSKIFGGRFLCYISSGFFVLA